MPLAMNPATACNCGQSRHLNPTSACRRASREASARAAWWAVVSVTRTRLSSKVEPFASVEVVLATYRLQSRDPSLAAILFGMDRTAMQAALDRVFDQALVFHGFTAYMRDYELITYSVADPKTGIAPAFDSYLFRYCVEASITSSLTPKTWADSLDERLIDHEAGKDLDGYVWGVKWQALYPGARLSEDSEKADKWARAVGIPFHEAVIEGNGHKIVLIFSDLAVARGLKPGYAPFTVQES